MLKLEFLKTMSSSNPTLNPEFAFNLLYSVYAFPNIILPFIGGILADKLGDGVMTMVFCFAIVLGQFLLFTGIRAGSIAWMIIGRFVFGLGGEAINITIKTILYKWFHGSELSLALSLNISLARSASVFSFYFSPNLLSKVSPNN